MARLCGAYCRDAVKEAGRPVAVVVGAGPAGAASAISLARQGFTVDVLEVRRTYTISVPYLYLT